MGFWVFRVLECLRGGSGQQVGRPAEPWSPLEASGSLFKPLEAAAPQHYSLHTLSCRLAYEYHGTTIYTSITSYCTRFYEYIIA